MLPTAPSILNKFEPITLPIAISYLFLTIEIIDVINSGKQYLKIQTFAFPAYTIFFMCNGFFIGLKKAEYAMASNLIRNFVLPILVYYIAVYLTVSLNTFFWLWCISNIIYSSLLLIFVLYFLKIKLNKSSAIVQP